jgi:nicotinate-nucleotide adenylyltransferase
MSIVSDDIRTAASWDKPPLTVGVFGGSFNPIHLGHALLAITTQQTKNVDQVVLVPVYKHAVKKDLLPFDDRVNMCQLAVAAFGDAFRVSTVERDVGESNGAMLRGLKKEYPAGTKFVWICGDDFFRWMDRPKGLETLQEVSGMVVQRRLHKSDADENFFKEPIDYQKVRTVAAKMDLEIDFIYGELPHFSSTLVRRAPGNWRSFLTQGVVKYLDERPHLLQQLIENLEADAQMEQVTAPSSSADNVLNLAIADSATWVMRGLDAVNLLQMERGRTGLCLSTGKGIVELQQAQASTDALLQEIMQTPVDTEKLAGFDEVQSLAAELKRIHVWLEYDRVVMNKRSNAMASKEGVEGWMARWALVEKFNPRVDVIMGATIRALTEILNVSDRQTDMRDLPELLLKWCEGKEALGRLRAFVCAGGPTVPFLVQTSLKMRERLDQTIATKERCIARVLSLEAGMSSRVMSAPEALHRMLENVTLAEWSLMGCFASSTPLTLVHKLLETTKSGGDSGAFDVESFFEASSSAIDFLLTFAKALAASGCARV